jgi:transposase-like protein
VIGQNALDLDSEGEVLDVLVQRTRDKATALLFRRRDNSTEHENITAKAEQERQRRYDRTFRMEGAE